MEEPRTASGLCSPSAHRTASVMLDLPDPFGPTITETPGVKSSLVRSGNDLKPLRLIDRRCMAIRLPGLSRFRGPLLLDTLERLRGPLLCGGLLGLAGAAPDLLAGDLRDRHEVAVVGGARGLDDSVGDELGAAGGGLLEARLVCAAGSGSRGG